MHRNEWTWKHNKPKPVRHCKSTAKGKVHSNTGLPQETRKTLNRQPNFTPKTTGKMKGKKPHN